MTAYRPAPGVVTITTGAGMTADEAVEGLFPDDATTVLMNVETWGPTVVYTYWLDYVAA